MHLSRAQMCAGSVLCRCLFKFESVTIILKKVYIVYIGQFNQILSDIDTTRHAHNVHRKRSVEHKSSRTLFSCISYTFFLLLSLFLYEACVTSGSLSPTLLLIPSALRAIPYEQKIQYLKVEVPLAH